MPWWLVSFLFCGLGGMAAAELTAPPEVLVVNSYHPGYLWAEEEMAGISEVFSRANPPVRFAAEYLDWKRFPVLGNEERFLALLQFKYGSRPPRVALATDDAALTFLLKHRPQLMPGVPIVFCGVTDDEYDRLFRGQAGIVGVTEKLFIKETLELALRLQPRARRVFVLHDHSPPGLVSLEIVRRAATAFAGRLEFDYAPATNFAGLYRLVEQLPPGALLLHAGIVVDSEGMPATRFTRQEFARRSAVPAFAMTEDVFKDLGVGGQLVSGVSQGAAAARLARRLLAGEALEALPSRANPAPRLVANYERLQRYGLSVRNLPPGAELVAAPDSMLQRYRWQILCVAALLVILSASVLALSFNVRRRQQAELALRQSEARTRLILQTALDAVVVMDAGGVITDWNPRAELMFGWPREEAVGRNLSETIVPPGQRKQHERGMMEFLRTGHGPLVNRRVELSALHRDGHEFPVEIAITPLRTGETVSFGAFLRDITERKRATEMLDRTVDLYRRAIAAAGAVPYLYDYQTETYAYMGEGIKELTGYEAGVMTPQLWNRIAEQTDLREEAAKAGNQDQATNLARAGKLLHWRSDSRVLTRDGRHRWIADASVEILGPDGRSTGSVGILADITERKAAEQALRDSEQRFRLMVENLPAGAVYVDPNTGSLQANKATEVITGFSRTEVGNLDRWFQAVGGEEAALLRRQYESDRRDGFPRPRLVILRHAQGQRRVVEFVAYAFASAEIWLLHDVTERARAEDALRESEERFRTVVESLGEAVVITDLGGVIEYVNPQIQQLTGHAPDELRGRRLAEVLRPSAEAAGGAGETSRGGTAAWLQGELSTTHRDGRSIWLLASSTPYRASDDRVIGTVCVVSDLTARKRSEEQLLQAQKMEAIGTLAGGIAHDFNNILASIMLFCELCVLEGQGNPVILDYLGGMLKGCHRARELVRQILTFSRQQGQKREVIRLQPLLAEALKLMRASIPAMIEIRSDINPEAPPVVADATQMHQVIINLCANAAHAMRSGHGILAVTLEAVDVDVATVVTLPELLPGRHARLTVSDTGHGMDTSTRERIFEPFFTTKPTGEGTGLGLSVVHGIVRAHQGTIAVRSAPGHGSVFELYFPASVSDAPAALSPVHELPAGGGRHILLVDDEPALLDVVARTLRRWGYVVTAHASPPEALAAFAANPAGFHAAVLDLAMPEISGLDLARRLRALGPHLRVILTSGHFRPEDAERAKALGIDGLVPKPYTPAELGFALAGPAGGPQSGPRN